MADSTNSIGTNDQILKSNGTNITWANLTKSQVTTALGYTPPTTNTTYTANTSKLVTTTVPNVTAAGSIPSLSYSWNSYPC